MRGKFLGLGHYVGDVLSISSTDIVDIYEHTDDIPAVPYEIVEASGLNWLVGESSVEFISWADDKPEDTVLDIAKGLVYGDRNEDYGHPKEDMDRTAKMWSAILGTEVTAEKVALCMCAVKISRQINARKRDNLIDLAGYAEVADRIIRYEEGDTQS